MAVTSTTNEQILDKARELGKLISDHPAAQRYRDSVKSLRDDLETQRLITDYNRFLSSMMQKEQQGLPIEVSDKRKIEQLQTAIATNLKLQGLQQAQMDYVDLMRKVDREIVDSSDVEASPTAPSSQSSAAGGPFIS